MLCGVLSRGKSAAAAVRVRPPLRYTECEGNPGSTEAAIERHRRRAPNHENATMTLDTITLSRLQFAFTIGYHIIWPAYSIGIAGFIVLFNALWLRTGKAVYRDLMRFWIRLFA